MSSCTVMVAVQGSVYYLTSSQVVSILLQTSTNVHLNRVETVVAALTRSTVSLAHVLWDTREPTAELVRSNFLNHSYFN